jgi:hypothetical protein
MRDETDKGNKDLHARLSRRWNPILARSFCWSNSFVFGYQSELGKVERDGKEMMMNTLQCPNYTKKDSAKKITYGSFMNCYLVHMNCPRQNLCELKEGHLIVISFGAHNQNSKTTTLLTAQMLSAQIQRAKGERQKKRTTIE